MTMKEKIRIHIEIQRENERKLKEWKSASAITFRRVYLIGGESGKADETDYIIGYKASNGRYIEIRELINNTYRWYVVDGVSYRTLAQAKSAC